MKAIFAVLIILNSFSALSQTTLDSVIYKHPVMGEQLQLIQENSCYYRPHYAMPFAPDFRPQRCDSLSPLFTDELYRSFTPEQLFELVRKSGSYHIQLYSFLAFCRSPYNSDSLVAYFEERFAEAKNP